MSFQSDTLTLLALGIRGDQPVDPDQPPLVDGIHLRWAFRQDLGFPWHGFYLFRRDSEPRRTRCLGELLTGLSPGTPAGGRVETPLGILSSSRPLLLVEEFPPGSVVEVDLDRGAPLRFDLPSGVRARQVDVRVGFREAAPAVVRTCVDFRLFPLGSSPGPRTEKGAVFTVPAPPVSPPEVVTSIEQWSGGPPGLHCSRRLEVTLPCPATRVDLVLTNHGPLGIEAFESQGAGHGVRSFGRQTLRETTVTFEGEEITRVVVECSVFDSALLHEICWECLSAGGGGSTIKVRALAKDALVGQTVLQGKAGDVVSASIAGDDVNAVEIGPGSAVLVDLCYLPSRRTVAFGWEEVRGFQYPLCLPVAHPDYPCPSKPATSADAKALALSRVTYGPPGDWDGAEGVGNLHDMLVSLVEDGPGGKPMAARTLPDLPGDPLSPATQADVPTVPGLRPLDLVVLASLHPAIAQMVGLYFADPSAEPGVAYDYLVLADPTGMLGGSAATALQWLALTPDPQAVDAYLVTGKTAAPAPALKPPGAARAYALPGATTRAVDGQLALGQGNVGLAWEAPPVTVGKDEPDRLVFYYPKRASLGLTEPSIPPAVGDYALLEKLSPVLLARPLDPSGPGGRNPEWPPWPLPIQVVDSNLDEGWYAYGLAGQDLFGRRSALGPPAEWYQWDPPADVEAPWYYQPSGHHAIHAFAVAVLDKIPPPPPTGVEAWALDPLDRWVLQDEAYENWRQANPSLVGLRVRWRWTLQHQIQAPDRREFRLYYQPSRLNAVLGRVVKVTAASADESDVETDIADNRPADAFAGARLQVGNDSFAIVASQPGAALRLRVKNVGPHDDVGPPEGRPCTVAIPEGHPLFADFSRPRTWARRLWVQDYANAVGTVIDPSKDPEGKSLTDDAVGGMKASVVQDVVQLPADADLSAVQPWLDHLWLKEDTARPSKTYPIVKIDAAGRRVTLDGTPSLAQSPSGWVIGRPVREYEVFLPMPDIGTGEPFRPTLAEPTVYAHVAVSAADVRTHTADDPKWDGDPLGKRYGNEGRVGPAATVFRVRQEPPEPPELPDLPERLLATPADYHSRSFFTFRWKPVDHLKTHLLRALDDSLFQRDWEIRQTRTALDPINPRHPDFFPDGWDATRRQNAADLLNAIASDTDYDALSEDAWEVLALLPGNEGIAAGPGPVADAETRRRTALKERDASIRHTRESLAAGDDEWFPKSWDVARRDNAAKALNALGQAADYPALPDNALRILAGLPGNEAAFTQLTIDPLDMDDAGTLDRRGPDDLAVYQPDGQLRAFEDTLPGRATNRYFYRSVFVDGAHNVSVLSLATPPVYLPNVEPPRTPVITKVVGGDREVTLRWVSRAELGLTEYRVYRTLGRDETRDLRLMTRVLTEPAPTGDPTGPTEMVWTDRGVPSLTEIAYRLTAVDHGGTESAPSQVVVARAYRAVPPEPPKWLDAVRLELDGAPAVRLRWSLGENLEVLVQRRLAGRTVWSTVAVWLPAGSSTFDDVTIDSGLGFEYRLLGRDAARQQSKASEIREVPP